MLATPASQLCVSKCWMLVVGHGGSPLLRLPTIAAHGSWLCTWLCFSCVFLGRKGGVEVPGGQSPAVSGLQQESRQEALRSCMYTACCMVCLGLLWAAHMTTTCHWSLTRDVDRAWRTVKAGMPIA